MFLKIIFGILSFFYTPEAGGNKFRLGKAGVFGPKIWP
jgi:hypothetical protein